MSEAAITPRKGEVWKVRHSRKGELTLWLKEDVCFDGDHFFDAEVVEGKVRYLSDTNKFLQDAHGKGTQGDVISCRPSLTTFLEKVEVAGEASQ